MKKRSISILVSAVLVIGIAFFSFHFVYGADKPTVTTVSAQPDETRSIIKGVIKATGGKEISQYGFKWGSNKSLSESKTFKSLKVDKNEFSFTLSNLKAGQTYYYQAFAVNAKGTAYGKIKSFKIPVNQAPEIAITSPTDKIELSRGTVLKIAAAASDDQRVEAMSLYINQKAQLKVKDDSISYDWDTSRAEPGSYPLTITASDGSQESSKQISVNVKAPDADNAPADTPKIVAQSNTYTPSRGVTGDPSRYPLLSKMNGIYGQFRYRNTSGGRIEVDPAWVAENIVTITLPGLNRKVQVHKAAADNFIQAFTYIKNGTATINGRQVPLLSLIRTMDGTYVTRHVMWDPSRGLSNHSWGTAIDINAADHLRYVNPGSEPNDPNLILWEKAFKPAGFSWGNSFSDSMHYELK